MAELIRFACGRRIAMTCDKPGPLIRDLRRAVTHGLVVAPDDAGWDLQRRGWNLHPDQSVLAVVTARHVDDIAAVVRYAAARHLPVTVQAHGHGTTRLLDGCILVRTSELAGIALDRERARATVAAGTSWAALQAGVSPLGLSGPCGSADDVGVVGYTLGGGLGWFGRRYGWAANRVRSVEAISAHGERIIASPTRNPDLFWALRGGGGDFAIVTAMTLDLLPARALYGGRLAWPVEKAPEVLAAYRELTARAPEELSLWFALQNLPDAPQLPAELRGRSLVAVQAVYLGAPGSAEQLLQPLRRIDGALVDTLRRLSPAELNTVAAEPVEPMAALEYSLLFSDLTDELMTDVLAVAGHRSDSPWTAVRLRHLGGALATPAADGGCVEPVAEQFGFTATGILYSPADSLALGEHVEVLTRRLRRHASARRLFNFLGENADARPAFSPRVFERLRTIKAARDPLGVLRSNRPIIESD